MANTNIHYKAGVLIVLIANDEVYTYSFKSESKVDAVILILIKRIEK